MSSFKERCAQKGFLQGNILSHALMDGGVLHVPYDSMPDFYEMYIASVHTGEHLFVVEQKTDVYNFFVDLDYKDEACLCLDDIKRISKIICDKVKFLGGGTSIISVSEPKPCGSLIKTGIHINWPGFHVKQASALALREHILTALYTIEPDKEWNDVVDTAVYRNGCGLRLPWSHKRAKHTACGGLGCSVCRHTGKETQLAYLPVFTYDTQGIIQTMDPSPNVDLLKLVSLRTDATVFKVIHPPTRLIKKEGSFTERDTKNEVHNEELRDLLEKFIQKNLEGQHDAKVTKMYKDINSYKLATTSRYCENLARDHNSNHIWFTVNGDIISQKCFCQCDTTKGRRYGMCKNYTGQNYVVTDKIKAIMYPNGGCLFKPFPKTKKTPVIKHDDVVADLENFFTKHVKKNIKIVSITKQKGNTFDIKTEDVTLKIIKKSVVINTDTYALTDNILKKLYPNT